MFKINKHKPKTSSVAFCVVKVTVIVLLRPGANEVGSKAMCISLLGKPEKKNKIIANKIFKDYKMNLLPLHRFAFLECHYFLHLNELHIF